VSTVNLDGINKSKACKPWALTFCFGRALQTSVLKAWKGKKENVHTAQTNFMHRTKCSSLAIVVASMREKMWHRKSKERSASY